MKSHSLLLGLLLAFFLTGCCCPAPGPCASVVMEDADGADETSEVEEAIPLSQVPARVLQAARARLPGIVFEEAEREVVRGHVVYGLEGSVDGKEYELDVTEDGQVLEVEADRDDGADDAEDEDEDDEGERDDD